MLAHQRTCPGRVTSRYSWSRSDAALGQPAPLRQQGGPVVGMDVLQELLVADILGGVAGERSKAGFTKVSCRSMS